MDQRKSILLVRLKSMGDVLFTLPAVHALRARFPDAPITFLVSKEYVPLIRGFQDVNSVIELDRSRFRDFHPAKITIEALALLRRIRGERPRLAIDFQGYGETALLTWLSSAPERWGIFYRKTRKWAYTRSVPRDYAIHPASDFLVLLGENETRDRPVKNHFALPGEALTQATSFFSTYSLRTDKNTLFIQPFTSASEKNWPLQHYLEVAQLWRSRGWQVLFGGGPADRNALGPVLDAGYPVAAGVPLIISAGLVCLSQLVLGGDTGLVHLAVAMGKRVIMLVRSLMPGSTYPFQHKDWAIGPEAEGLISSIRTETVNESCRRACSELGIVS